MDNLMILSVLSMVGLAAMFAAVLAFADKKLRVEEDPKVEEVSRILPGVNCGACGALSCHDFAEHIVLEGEDPAKCRVIHEELRKKIYELMGKEETEVLPVIALVKCSAGWENKKTDADYKGIRTCKAAKLIFGSGMHCEYGCMGFGDCTRVCPFDAIHMDNGLPVVDPNKCTGCGQCAEECPKNIIEMQTKKNAKMFYVACSSNDDMMRTRKVCSVGCIACGVCVKLSQEGFFKLENNLSIAAYDKQDKQEEIKAIQSKCPTKVIKDI